MTDIERRGTRVDGGWRDHDGFVGPKQPGTGPRSDPKGAYPTGPEVGQPMPDIRCPTADGARFNLHEDRAGRPAVFIFYRSAVW